ncbi:uncharacterized protein LOC127837025 isoform X2 [Dreissena polymorpha]|uniref:Small RNA 2'-O-methyltransferase n=2 Tax=Dreissena polymorpha TaxID=45954 RepID=A0A9D4F8F9_DREPO|nr:uncharacterized protein LOC127837025 isoform X2 [Dreissena polymorpha]XP_052219688.1 uncharacterized protein LOC127837025 isoform X2 [Dreissena polymorpha]KAH3791966.1 hypothetical protein DPMN_145455 [Dreissena polymorpha]
MDVETKSPQSTEKEEQLGGPVFEPRLYIQRYFYVAQQLEKYNVQRVVDFGSAELKISRFLVNVTNVKDIALVDLDGPLLSSSKRAIQPLTADYLLGKHVPVMVKVYQGSVTDLDKNIVGFDAVTMVEIIEHLQPDVLADAVSMVFGNLQPRVVVMTTPNSDYNVLFPGFSGFRHWDHKFEWNQQEFKHWCTTIASSYGYHVEYGGVGDPPPGSEALGFCSQAAIFVREGECQPPSGATVTESYVLMAESFYPVKAVSTLPVDQQLLMEIRYVIRQYQSGLHYNKTCVRGTGILRQEPDTGIMCVKDCGAGNQRDVGTSALRQEQDNGIMCVEKCSAGNQIDDGNCDKSPSKWLEGTLNNERVVIKNGFERNVESDSVVSVRSDSEEDLNRNQETKTENFSVGLAVNQNNILGNNGDSSSCLLTNDRWNKYEVKNNILCECVHNSEINNKNILSQFEFSESACFDQNICHIDSCVSETWTVKNSKLNNDNKTDDGPQIDSSLQSYIECEGPCSVLANWTGDVCDFNSCIDCQRARYQLSEEDYLVPISSLLKNKTVTSLWPHGDDISEFLQNHGFRLTEDNLYVIMALDEGQDFFDFGDNEDEDDEEVRGESSVCDDSLSRNISQPIVDRFDLETEDWN